jgi:hypothetical protein
VWTSILLSRQRRCVDERLGSRFYKNDRYATPDPGLQFRNRHRPNGSISATALALTMLLESISRSTQVRRSRGGSSRRLQATRDQTLAGLCIPHPANPQQLQSGSNVADQSGYLRPCALSAQLSSSPSYSHASPSLQLDACCGRNGYSRVLTQGIQRIRDAAVRQPLSICRAA